MSKRFQNYLSSNGILHQVSCPSTLEQNVCAERKHRHMVEIGPTLFFNAQMPPSYQVEAFLTATYLINRMPSKGLHLVLPWEKLIQCAPDYSTLGVFGCVAILCLDPILKPSLTPVPSNTSFYITTLTTKATCVLIGPLVGCFTLDVVFDETMFSFGFFESSSPNSPHLNLMRCFSQVPFPLGSDLGLNYPHLFLNLLLLLFLPPLYFHLYLTAFPSFLLSCPFLLLLIVPNLLLCIHFCNLYPLLCILSLLLLQVLSVLLLQVLNVLCLL